MTRQSSVESIDAPWGCVLEGLAAVVRALRVHIHILKSKE